jgi:hypothetical protein
MRFMVLNLDKMLPLAPSAKLQESSSARSPAKESPIFRPKHYRNVSLNYPFREFLSSWRQNREAENFIIQHPVNISITHKVKVWL